jgi:hypothetical protein
MMGGMTVLTLINLGPQLESYSLHDEKSFFPLQAEPVVVPEMMNHVLKSSTLSGQK